MKILIVKFSSLGDILHTFPAVSDAVSAFPGIQVDWVVEEGYAGICKWHPAVNAVIKVGFRRWRKRAHRHLFDGTWPTFRSQVQAQTYDAVIDAQGLCKSAVVTSLAHGPRHGFDFASCREKPAPFAYDHRHSISVKQHAITRNRQLFALALGYPVPPGSPNFGLRRRQFGHRETDHPFVVFVHGAGWQNRRWTIARWQGLADIALRAGYEVWVPWHSRADHQRALAIAGRRDGVHAVRADQQEMIRLIAKAAAVVGMDTGFAHLSAALNVPTVSLYGPNAPDFHGTTGQRQIHLSRNFPCSPCRKRICAFTGNMYRAPPCLAEITESDVWNALLELAFETKRKKRVAKGSGRPTTTDTV